MGAIGLGKLMALKFLSLGIVFLSLMPPFSFAYLTVGGAGFLCCLKSMKSVKDSQVDAKYWAASGGLCFVILLGVVL